MESDSVYNVSECSDEAVAARGRSTTTTTRHRLGGRRYTTKAMEKRHDIGYVCWPEQVQ